MGNTIKNFEWFVSRFLASHFPHFAFLKSLCVFQTEKDLPKRKNAYAYITYDRDKKKIKIVIDEDVLKNTKMDVLSYKPEHYFGKDKKINAVVATIHELIHLVWDHIGYQLEAKDDEEFRIKQLAAEYFTRRTQVDRLSAFFGEDIEMLEMFHMAFPELAQIPYEKLTLKKIEKILKRNKDKLSKVSCSVCVVEDLEELKKLLGEKGFKEIQEELKNLKASLKNFEAMKFRGLGKETIGSLEIEDERGEWYEELTSYLAFSGLYVRHKMDVPSLISIFDERILYPERLPYTSRVFVIIDVSSSMSEDEIKEGLRFLSKNFEFSGIITHNEQVIQEFSSFEEMLSVKLEVGGGTDYTEAYEKASKYLPYTDFVIHITDGVCPLPENFEEIKDKIVFVITSKQHYDWVKDVEKIEAYE